MFKLRVVWSLVFVLGVVLAVLCQPTFAQVQTGEILGTVTDASGGAVPGATIAVTNTDTGITRVIKTGDQGRYAAPDLNIGAYQVRVEMRGFSTETQKGFVLAVGENLVVDFKLEVGAVAQEVTVNSSAAPQINTTTSEVGSLVGEQQLQELPLNGRNFTQEIFLAPTVQPQETAAGTGSLSNAPRYSVAGSQIDTGGVLLDGVQIRNFQGTGAGLVEMGTSLGVESIAEFKVYASNFNALYSQASVVSEVTRSGTNNLHGSAYGFFRNSAMDARSYFNSAPQPVTEFHRNQFGGALGGPIKKEKSFFFVNYEGLRAAPTLANNLVVPNHQAHLGNLPCTAAPTFACVGGVAKVPINSVMLPYLALYPDYGQSGQPALPAGYTDLGNGTASFTITGQEPQSENYVSSKLDYQLTAKNNISARYVVDHGLLINPWSNGASGQFPIAPNFEHGLEQNQYLTVQDRHIFSSSLVNVASASFVRTWQGEPDDLTKVPAILNFNPQQPGTSPFGSLTISGMASFTGSTSYPFLFLQNVFTGQDEVDWIHGNHDLKIGGSVSRMQDYVEEDKTDGYTFSNLSSFLQGIPTSLTGPTSSANAGRRRPRQTTLSIFIQDDWKVRKNLTLNLGIRDDYVTNPTEASCSFAGGCLWRITNDGQGVCSNDPICDGGAPVAGVSTFYTAETHYFAQNPSTRNIDPRVGLAWDIFGDHKTSFRAGYGIFHSIIYPRIYGVPANFQYPPLQGNITGGFVAPGTVGNPQQFPTAPITAGIQQLHNQIPWVVCCTPYINEWNASLERQLPLGLSLTLSYVGSAGVHLWAQGDNNTNLPEVIPGLKEPDGTLAPGGQYRPPVGTKTGPNVGCGTVPGNISVDCVPNVAFSLISGPYISTNSHYNAGVVEVQRRMGTLTFQSAYTYSSCIDNGSSAQGADTPNDSRMIIAPQVSGKYNEGPCAFNLRHNWTSNFLIPLPLHGNRLKDGWEFAVISSVRSGEPVTPVLPSTTDDISNLGYYDYVTERPNLNPNFSGPLVLGTLAHYFNPAAFVQQPLGYLGSAPRGMLTAPGYFDEDFSVIKSTSVPKLMEGNRLEIRADFFNVFNHPNFGMPNNKIFNSPGQANPQAGAITSIIGNQRELQLSARFVFLSMLLCHK